jgi:hypothetical protein
VRLLRRCLLTARIEKAHVASNIIVSLSLVSSGTLAPPVHSILSMRLGNILI